MQQSANLTGQCLGHYRLIQQLGQGGFAEVYLAEHIHLKTQIAVKVLLTHLTEEAVETFRREAQTLARLRHPSIVHVHDFGIAGDTAYLVMDYAPHGTLRHLHPKGQYRSNKKEAKTVKVPFPQEFGEGTRRLVSEGFVR